MRRQYVGAAQASTLTAPLGGSTADLTITCSDLTNWPTGVSGHPFYIVIDRNKPTEEKILCASRSGNVITVYDNGITNGRAADGTAITAHASNATIEHVFTATDADEANAHVNASSGVHGLSGSVVGTTDTQTLTNKTISQAQITNLVSDLALKAPLASPTFTGTLTAATANVVSPTTTGSTGVRQMTISTSDPSGGADGDIWIKYVP